MIVSPQLMDSGVAHTRMFPKQVLLIATVKSTSRIGVPKPSFTQLKKRAISLPRDLYYAFTTR
jgi:hypothetical protein